jgi:diaminopimelate decarboxylase
MLTSTVRSATSTMPPHTDSQERDDWWERDDLHSRDGRLHFAGQDVYALAQAVSTPVYFYNPARVRQNLLRLHEALDAQSLDHRIFYAMKSNRYAPLLTYLKGLGLCGIDACSPRELLLARQCGFRQHEISYTATSVSEEDLRVLAHHPEVWINCDSLSSLRRLGELCPNRAIGLRVNPSLGVGYGSNELLRYAGAKATKFGIYRDRFEEALQIAAQYKLRVTGLHFHTGCGYLTPQLPVWENIIAESLWFLDQVPEVKHVNVGGGLGIPLTEDDQPLDLEAWAGVLKRQLGDRNVQIWVEPGDYLVKDAGVLVLQVNTVEQKMDTVFVGVNGGFNIHLEPAFYQLPLHVVPCRQRDKESNLHRVTIAGNINEALDILASDISLPPVQEGDRLAFLNAGGYGAAMSSNHCMRGDFSEYLLM